MASIWFAAGLLAVIAAGVWLWRSAGRSDDSRERPVLPAQYSSLLQMDRTRYPGLCASCGTENTPGYNFCKECGERLPGGTERRDKPDVSQIFRE